jgi:hypothetical protein
MKTKPILLAVALLAGAVGVSQSQSIVQFSTSFHTVMSPQPGEPSPSGLLVLRNPGLGDTTHWERPCPTPGDLAAANFSKELEKLQGA